MTVDIRTIYADAAFQAGHELAQHDEHLNFCMGDSTAMADAAVAAYKAELVKALDCLRDVRATVGSTDDFRRGARVAYDDALSLLTDPNRDRREPSPEGEDQF